MPFTYKPYRNPYVGSISKLLGQEGDIRAKELSDIANVQSSAEQSRGDIWGGEIKSLGNIASQGLRDRYEEKTIHGPKRIQDAAIADAGIAEINAGIELTGLQRDNALNNLEKFHKDNRTEANQTNYLNSLENESQATMEGLVGAGWSHDKAVDLLNSIQTLETATATKANLTKEEQRGILVGFLTLPEEFRENQYPRIREAVIAAGVPEDALPVEYDYSQTVGLLVSLNGSLLPGQTSANPGGLESEFLRAQIREADRGNMAVPGSGAPTQTPAQATAQGYANSMFQANKNLARYDYTGQPDGEEPSWIVRTDTSFHKTGQSLLPDYLLRIAASDEYRGYMQATNAFINAILRDQSGAAITDDDRKIAMDSWIARSGDPVNVIERKRRAREWLIRNLNEEAQGFVKNRTTGEDIVSFQQGPRESRSEFLLRVGRVANERTDVSPGEGLSQDAIRNELDEAPTFQN